MSSKKLPPIGGTPALVNHSNKENRPPTPTEVRFGGHSVKNVNSRGALPPITGECNNNNNTLDNSATPPRNPLPPDFFSHNPDPLAGHLPKKPGDLQEQEEKEFSLKELETRLPPSNFPKTEEKLPSVLPPISRATDPSSRRTPSSFTPSSLGPLPPIS